MGDEDVLHRAEVVSRVRGVAAVLLDGHTELLRGLAQQTRGVSAMEKTRLVSEGTDSMKEVSVVFGGKAFQETLQCRRQAVVRFISAVFV